MSETNKDLILREKLSVQRTRMANQTTFFIIFKNIDVFYCCGIKHEKPI